MTQIITPQITIRILTLLESVTLILEKTKGKFLSHVSISFWHLILESY